MTNGDGLWFNPMGGCWKIYVKGIVEVIGICKFLLHNNAVQIITLKYLKQEEKETFHGNFHTKELRC